MKWDTSQIIGGKNKCLLLNVLYLHYLVMQCLLGGKKETSWQIYITLSFYYIYDVVAHNVKNSKSAQDIVDENLLE